MATYSTGVAASFGGSALSEVVGLSWNWGSGHSRGRSLNWKPVLGRVQVEMLGFAATSRYGQRGTLAVTGGGVNLTCTAVCTDLSVAAEVNGVARYTYTFDIMDN